ncbi:MAG: metallophosphoesterase [Candidatus Krumholzibacteriia bacterium]
MGTFVRMIRARDALLILLAFVALGLILNAAVRLALPGLWRRRGVRASVLALLLLDALVPGAWFLLKRLGRSDAADGLVTVQLALCGGQLAVLAAVAMMWLWRGSRQPIRPSRRRLLIGAAVALPMVAAGTGAAGVAESASPARLRRRRLTLPRCPAPLEGLRILHLSDVHLWHLVTVDDLGRALARVPRGEYDLVCVTGDLADDLAQLPEALRMIAALDAPLGHFACLGNHEHARGLQAALRAFAAGPVTLLRGSGQVLTHRGQRFVLAGIDDLRAQPRATQAAFYPEQLRHALGPTSPDAFSVVLSHRPSVLPHAAAAGVDLVLAGHTHGGQVAIGGTSLLEINGAAPWAWGVYRREETVMHVTCGLGQWFPFRLGCPPEMVLLELAALPSPPPVR